MGYHGRMAMRASDLWRMSAGHLGAHRLRTALTTLSIAIGAASIVALSSLAQSGLATLTRGIEEVGGTRFVMIMTGAPKGARAKRDHYTSRLNGGDREALAQAVPNLETIFGSIGFYGSSLEAAGRKPFVTTVLGTEPTYFRAYRMRVDHGRALSAEDMRDRRRVAVVGAELEKALFGAGAGLGKTLRFRDEPYAVVGVLTAHQKANVNLGYDWEKVALVPLTAPAVGSEIEQIAMTMRRTEDTDLAVRVANSVLLHRHHDVDNFEILDFGGLLRNFYLAFAIMQILVGVIAGVALVIGGVGVMNIMLVAVNERMREIGLRKAIGAPEGAIMAQFLVEALLMSLWGALSGVLAGLVATGGISAVIAALNPAWIPLVAWPAVVVALFASGLVGVFFGWYPASRAAKLDPILALRNE